MESNPKKSDNYLVRKQLIHDSYFAREHLVDVNIVLPIRALIIYEFQVVNDKLDTDIYKLFWIPLRIIYFLIDLPLNS
jgi:hypothetical protein